MDKRLENTLKNLTDADLREWSDLRSISRAAEYGDSVHDIVAMDGGGVAAVVAGTHEYLATIYPKDDGDTEMECSCPVGYGCKHCVALARKCHEILNAGKKIKTLAKDDPYWRDLKDKFGEFMGIFGDDASAYDDGSAHDGEKDTMARISELDKDGLRSLLHDLIQNVPDVEPYLSLKFGMADASPKQIADAAREAIEEATKDGYDCWEHHRRGYWDDGDYDDAPDYSSVKDHFERLAKLGNIKELMNLCDYFIKRGTEQLKVSNDEGDMICEMQECVEVVAHAVFSSGLPDSEKLIWQYKRETCDEFGFLESNYDASLSYWSREGISAEEWSKVADAILQDCKAESDSCNLSDVWRHLSTALHNAGRGDETIDIAKNAARTPKDYLRVVEALHTKNRIEEAAEWCLKGLSESKRDDWHCGRFKNWLKQFAEERGDWPVVAAYDAANFISYPCIERFRALETPCRKAGMWETTRSILLHCLESGEQPLSNPGWPLPKPGFSEAELNAKTYPMSELLCRIALHEKRIPDIAKWFWTLTGLETPAASHDAVWHNQTLAFEVADAIKVKLPDKAIQVWNAAINANCRWAGDPYYQTIVRALKAMKPTMVERFSAQAWRNHVAELRTKFSRRRNLAKMLDALLR